MYKEVAFDPQCLSEYHYYGLLKSSFGFEQGRYVVAPVREWAREAFNAVKKSQNIQPIKRKSIINFLNKLQKEKSKSIILLPEYRSNIVYDNWVDWLMAQDTNLPFDTVISERVVNAIDYEKLIDGDKSWLMPSTVRVKKRPTDITLAIAPLLRFGGHLYIVDLYFSLANNPVLTEIFSLIQHYHSIHRITLVTSIKSANPQGVFNKEYAETFAYLPKFEIVIAQSKFFHDRYIFTDAGAIKGGHGFSHGVEKDTQADKLSIGLCGFEECQETMRWVETILEDGRASKVVLVA